MGPNKVIFAGEQWGATGSHVTGSDRKSHDRKRRCPEPEVCYAQQEVSQYPLVGPSHRKWRQWPEVIVCACATGTFCITTRVVVQVPWLPVTEGVEGCAHAQPEVAQYPLMGPFHRKLTTGNDVIFPRIFLSSSTKCWLGGVLYDFILPWHSSNRSIGIVNKDADI